MDKKRVEELKDMLKAICSVARLETFQHHAPFGLPSELTVQGRPVRWLFDALDSLVTQEPTEEEKMYQKIGELSADDTKPEEMIRFINHLGAAYPDILGAINWTEVERMADEIGIHHRFVAEAPVFQINTDIPCKDIKRELIRGARKYGPVFNSPNEALGTIYSEFTELKNAIVAHEPPARIREEAVQVAVMAIKLVQYLDREAAGNGKVSKNTRYG